MATCHPFVRIYRNCFCLCFVSFLWCLCKRFSASTPLLLLFMCRSRRTIKIHVPHTYLSLYLFLFLSPLPWAIIIILHLIRLLRPISFVLSLDCREGNLLNAPPLSPADWQWQEEERKKVPSNVHFLQQARAGRMNPPPQRIHLPVHSTVKTIRNSSCRWCFFFSPLFLFPCCGSSLAVSGRAAIRITR